MTLKQLGMDNNGNVIACKSGASKTEAKLVVQAKNAEAVYPPEGLASNIKNLPQWIQEQVDSKIFD